jgi:hypothetical protein
MNMTLLAIAIATTLSGIVLDETAAPIPNAHVYVYTATPKTGVSSLCPSCYRDCGKHTPVDAKGRFKIESLDSTLTFDILTVADGYEPKFTRRVDPSSAPINVQLSRRSREDADRLITGIVVDPDGKPVVGAIVEPSGYRLGRRVGFGGIPGLERLSITNAKGEFALRIPSAEGKLDVRVTARSLAPHIDRMLEPGQTRTIRLEGGSTVVGRITRKGVPVVGSRVALIQQYRPSSDFLGRADIGTDEQGRFTLTNIGPNDVYYLFTPLEGTCEIVEPTLVKTGPDGAITDAGTLEQHAGRRVTGWIELPPGYTVPADSRLLVMSMEVGDAHEATLRNDGTFVVEGIPEGKLVVDARIAGLKMITPRELPSRGDVTELRLVFAPGAR